MKLFDLINPVKIMAFFTFYGGGSGGGGSSNPDTRYSNLDALYGTQNQASQYMLDNAMPKIPGLMKNSQSMVDEAMDGTLASTMRNRASYDANESISSANNDAIRNLTKYGAVGDPSGGRYADTVINNAKNASATRVGAMNKANQYAEDQKWNRNANMYGQVMGMNSGAMQGMSSAGAGMGAIAGQQTANDQRNAAGYGQAGAAFGSALMKADGGFIEGEKPVRLADGGDAWSKYKAANPVSSSSGSGRGGRTNPYMAMLSGASPYLAAAGVKDIFKGKDSGILKAGKDAYGKGEALFRNYEAMKKAQEAQDSVSKLQFETDPNVVAGNVGTEAGAQVGTDVGAQVGADIGTEVASNVGAGTVDMGVEGVSQVGQVAAPAVVEVVDLAVPYAKGGCVKKANAYAMGGLANNSVSSSNKIDNTATVANLDASSSMDVSKMGTSSPVNKMETHAKPVLDTQYSGKTDGKGESSDGDPDGFGSKSADNRHLGGSATLTYLGGAVGGAYGGPWGAAAGKVVGKAAGEVLHPIGEAVSRQVISSSDKLGRGLTGGSDFGGFAVSMHNDPIGTLLSGKYFAEGGRVDHTDGGDVQGPGTETSDDIPAWLSDGEFVVNAEAVKIVGKDKLEAINNAGLEKRKNQFACGGAVKHGVKLAGGGFLGGNLGVAMGAGVDQWNKQQELDQRQQVVDMQKQAAEQAKEKMGWERVDRNQKDATRAAMTTAADVGADSSAVSGMYGDLERRVKSGEVTKEQADAAKAAYRDSNYSPDALARKAGSILGKQDLSAGMALEHKLRENNTGQVIGGMMRNKATTPDLIAAYADVNPGKALEMQVKDENVDARLRAVVENNAARLAESERRTQAAIDKAYLGGRSSSSGSRGDGAGKADEGTKAGHGIIDKLASNDIKFAGGTKEAPVEVTGLDLHPIARTLYSDLISRPDNKLSPERAAYMSIELAKSSKGLPNEYSKNLIVDENGDFTVTARNTAGKDEAVISRNIGNPESFLGGTNEEKAKLLSLRRSDAALNFFGSEAKVREMAKQTPQDVADAVKLIKEKNPNIDEKVVALRLNKFIGHAKEFERLNPVKPTMTPQQEFSKSFNEQTQPLGYRMADAVGGVAQAINPFRTGSIEENRKRSREGLNTP